MEVAVIYYLGLISAATQVFKMTTTYKILVTLLLQTLLLIAAAVAGDGILCLQRERQALLKFKAEVIDTHGHLSSWETGTECCQWRGIVCHNTTNHGRVVALDVSGFNPSLQGKTLSPSLLELDELTYLHLSFIDFNGTQIPQFVGSLRKLHYLNLSNCHFGGSIPHSLGNLSSLQFLDLNTNDLSLSSNLEWLSPLQSLKYLDLSSLNLNEARTWLQQINNLPLLQQINNLPLLQQIHFQSSFLPSALPISSLNHLPNSSNSLLVLDLSVNDMNLSAVFPWLLTHKNSLTYLDLSLNHIGGGIPVSFQIFQNLSHLDLHDTSLADNFTNLMHLSHSDHVPRNHGDDSVDQNWSKLTFLDLSENKLQGEFTHLITWLWDFTRLQHLDLSGGNSVFGSWPNMSRFQNLAHLDLRDNSLNGPIQQDFLRLPNLKFLDLSGNNLGGSIPNLSPCSSLRDLRLSNGNNFSGKLTESIGNLLELEFLDLSSNNLEGQISDVLFHNLSKLQVLDLSFNSNITIRMNPSWNPPFQLDYLALSGCILGQQFPIWLHNQSHISFLDISNTGILDTIPNWFQNNSRLLSQLNMSYNQIHGPFPGLPSTQIWILDLRFNEFSGTLPQLMLSSLSAPSSYIYLSSNKFSGSMNNCSFGNSFTVLDLSNNQLSGQISSDCWSDLLDGTSFLNLANNNLSGSIPPNIKTGYCGSLLSLQLRNNSFTGHIPSALQICDQLFDLDLGENKFYGNVPDWLGKCNPYLRILSLRNNQLDGNLPSSLCHLSSIQMLDISRNNISGIIPKCVNSFTGMSSISTDPLDHDGSVITNARLSWKGQVVEYNTTLWLVKLLDLSENNLSGEIPHEVTSLVELVSLNLSSNHLVGSIPQNISHLKNLNSLDLSRNNLSGGIPFTIAQLNRLGNLNLSSNNLSGKIPYDGHMDTFSNCSYLENPGLCGPPLSKHCPEDVAGMTRNPKFVDGTEHEDMFKSKESYISMVLGFIAFFWVVFGSLYFNKKWNVTIVKIFTTVEDWLYVKVLMNKRRVELYFQN